MIVKLLLDRKRAGEELTPAEIRELIAAYTQGDVPDYQMAAFAMAVCCRGMTAAETLALTESMRDSGTCLTWPAAEFPPTADKHSTGGVGDKISLITQPLAAACGLAVPSLTGRGLGLTGGTADKMESIPGYVAALSLADYRRVVATCGCSLTVQTDEIAPADRKLYGLRDVTGTVPSIPLIVASILSKKLAEGAGTLVFDVKCGSGAFMKTLPEARALAQALVAGAKGAGRRSCALVTAMDEPLGSAVGNANEVAEAMEVLAGRGPQDVRTLSIELAAQMVALAQWGEHSGSWEQALETARTLCTEKLDNGDAASRFRQMVELQGGDLTAFAQKREMPTQSREVVAMRSGYVEHIDAQRVAQAAFELGAGRARAEDGVDLLAGVDLRVARGDRVTAGMPIARVSTQTQSQKLPQAVDLVQAAISLAPQPIPPRNMVLETINPF